MRVWFVLTVTYAECHIEAPYADCHYAECLYAECHYAECHYAECCGAVKISSLLIENIFYFAHKTSYLNKVFFIPFQWCTKL